MLPTPSGSPTPAAAHLPRVVNIDCNFDYAYERGRLEAIGAELVLAKSRTEDEIIRAAAQADILVVEGPRTPVTGRVIAALSRCRAIVKYSVGVDNIDVEAATRSGIVVANAADYCTEEVSDHAVALLLASARQVMSMDRRIRAGGWNDFPSARPMRRMSELTLGLVGLGRIARATARKMGGFRMRILASDPYLAPGFPEPGIEVVPLDRLLREADLVSVHVPLTAETRGFIGEQAFGLMKPTAILVNTSRGGVVDEAALGRALGEKRIAGAALDVMAEEPLPASSPLRGFDQVILTPHQGSVSTDAMDHVRRTVTDSIEAVLSGRWPPFPVNPQVSPRVPLRRT